MAHAWKACWVQALGGSNPPSSATGPRDLLRFRGFCCLSRRWCSGRRRARPLCVPLGGGPPASRPRRVLLLVVPLVFWAPSGPAAREIATRELRSEWSISKPARALRALRRPPRRRHLCRLGKPGQAPPPPTGTAARPSKPVAPSTLAALVVPCAPAANRAVAALLSPGLVPLRLRGLR